MTVIRVLTHVKEGYEQDPNGQNKKVNTKGIGGRKRTRT